ncbi:hypothetical protein WAK64_14015 [Bacillus spongiae]|uniref:Uncharacterized protein n=1 Tax=Bacillus spongiae TaxID=2683610 RepID=A0ABU8HFL9_9BACI
MEKLKYFLLILVVSFQLTGYALLFSRKEMGILFLLFGFFVLVFLLIILMIERSKKKKEEDDDYSNY